jgi:hypothetical protein
MLVGMTDTPIPRWISHLIDVHDDSDDGREYQLGRLASSIHSYWNAHGIWPSRRVLFNGKKNIYPTAAAMDDALLMLDGAFTFRSEMGCSPICGAPVYKIAVKNRSGPPTIRYGFKPYLSQSDPTPILKERISGPLSASEVLAWHRIRALGLTMYGEDRIDAEGMSVYDGWHAAESLKYEIDKAEREMLSDAPVVDEQPGAVVPLAGWSGDRE